MNGTVTEDVNEEDDGYTLEDVLTTDDLDELLRIRLYVTQEIADLHNQKRNAQTVRDEGEIQGRLTVAYAIMNTCTDRIPIVREESRGGKMEKQRVDHNFRVIAKRYLNADTFHAIQELAFGRLQEAKEELKGKKHNKVAR